MKSIHAFAVLSSIGLSMNVMAGPAFSQTCLEETKALYGNEMNFYNRRPYRSEKVVFDPSGKQTHTFENVVENPLKTISGVKGSGFYTLTVDQEAWTGPSIEGPWTPTPTNFPSDRRAGHDAMRAAEMDGMSDAICHGEVDIDGQKAKKFEFSVKTDPIEEMGGMWLGDRSTVWIAVDTGEVLRWDRTNFTSNWAPEESKEVHVEVFNYDDTIKVTAPQ